MLKTEIRGYQVNWQEDRCHFWCPHLTCSAVRASGDRKGFMHLMCSQFSGRSFHIL